jgi:hypothetical protein
MSVSQKGITEGVRLDVLEKHVDLKGRYPHLDKEPSSSDVCMFVGVRILDKSDRERDFNFDAQVFDGEGIEALASECEYTQYSQHGASIISLIFI